MLIALCQGGRGNSGRKQEADSGNQQVRSMVQVYSRQGTRWYKAYKVLS